MKRNRAGIGTDKGLVAGFRSGLEELNAKKLEKLGVDPKFETTKVSYVRPETSHKYTPDFPLSKTIIIETKGRFVVADRQKHLLIKAQRPDLEVRFVFTRSKTPISKGSKTTYADWCDKNGFKYADKLIPVAWINEIKELNKHE
jgi:Phage endonuclease I